MSNVKWISLPQFILEWSRFIFENDNNYLLGSNLNPISRDSNDITGSMDYIGDIYSSLYLHVAFKA